MITPTVCIVQDCLGCLGYYCFHMNFKAVFSISVKNFWVDILMRDCFESVDCFTAISSLLVPCGSQGPNPSGKCLSRWNISPPQLCLLFFSLLSPSLFICVCRIEARRGFSILWSEEQLRTAQQCPETKFESCERAVNPLSGLLLWSLINFFIYGH